MLSKEHVVREHFCY